MTGCSQQAARARILAQVVLPVPRVPVNRYAWDSLPPATWADSDEVTLFCPTTSRNRKGRYFRYNARCPRLLHLPKGQSLRALLC